MLDLLGQMAISIIVGSVVVLIIAFVLDGFWDDQW